MTSTPERKTTVAKSVQHTVNMGKYETVEVRAYISVDLPATVDDVSIRVAQDRIDALVHAHMDPELVELRESTANEQSYIHWYHNEENK